MTESDPVAIVMLITAKHLRKFAKLLNLNPNSWICSRGLVAPRQRILLVEM